MKRIIDDDIVSTAQLVREKDYLTQQDFVTCLLELLRADLKTVSSTWRGSAALPVAGAGWTTGR